MAPGEPGRAEVIDPSLHLEKRTTLPDGRTVTYLARQGRGPTLVLLHGSGMNHYGLELLFEALEGHNVLAPAYPGRCGSDGPALERAEDVADWLHALLGTLGHTSAVLLGHSVGGGIALEYALRHGRSDTVHLGGLVLAGTGARLRVNPAILQVVAAAAAADQPVPVPEALWHPASEASLRARVAEVSAMTPARATLADWRICDNFDRIGGLSAIEVPALVLAGDSDPLTPVKYARYMVAHLARAELCVLEEAGHVFTIERAGETAALVTSWLARTASGS